MLYLLGKFYVYQRPLFIQQFCNVLQDVNETSNFAVDTSIVHLCATFSLNPYTEGRIIISTFRRRYFGKRITKTRDRNRILKYGAYFIADTDIKKGAPQCLPCCHEIFAVVDSACTADKTKSD